MKIFTIFGDLVIRLFDLVGMVILEIPNIPARLRGINTDNIKNKIDRESLKENISKIKDTGLELSEKGISKASEIKAEPSSGKNVVKGSSISNSPLSEGFTSEEKERTVFTLQITSLGFLVVSILYLFNFLSFIIYCILGIVLIGYMIYILPKVKSMYPADFNAYRDFFSMYILAGIILVLVCTNSSFVMAFSFQFFPNLTILIFAMILASAVFLIFRIMYRRDFTYGTVIEVGKKTAYVNVDYDIRSNVKPNIYIVDNSYGANEGEVVKLQIEEKILSTGGNKPVSIIGTLNK